MLDPFTIAIVKVLAGSAVKALITSHGPGADDWASATTKILDALLDHQSDTGQELRRIEKKIDDLSGQPFRMAFGSGQHFLNAARNKDDNQGRLADLNVALGKFVDALQVADTQPDPELSLISVKWHLAMVYLL